MVAMENDFKGIVTIVILTVLWSMIIRKVTMKLTRGSGSNKQMKVV